MYFYSVSIENCRNEKIRRENISKRVQISKPFSIHLYIRVSCNVSIRSYWKKSISHLIKKGNLYCLFLQHQRKMGHSQIISIVVNYFPQILKHLLLASFHSCNLWQIFTVQIAFLGGFQSLKMYRSRMLQSGE